MNKEDIIKKLRDTKQHYHIAIDENGKEKDYFRGRNKTIEEYNRDIDNIIREL